MSGSIEQCILDHLTFSYGAERAPALMEQLCTILDKFRQRSSHPGTAVEHSIPPEQLTGRDVILITYGDQVAESGKPPLQTLSEVLETHAKGVI